MPYQRTSPTLTNNARSLRQSQTDAEALIWNHLINRRLEGLKFRRQYRIGSYIADFACVDTKLIIELDGGQHSEATAEDAERSSILRLSGWNVLRFWNTEVFANLDGVFRDDQRGCDAPSPQPSPRGRGGKSRHKG